MTDAPAAAAAQEGACRCGRVRFRVTGDPLFTSACHCHGCQKMTASAFSLSSLYPADRFDLLQGEPVIGGMHGEHRHMHCPWCLSWLYTLPQGFGEIVNVRTTMLDTVPAEAPYIETYTSTALPWVKTGATHSFPEFPPIDRYTEIIAQFAERNAAD